VEGETCGECGGVGRFEHEGCPHKLIPPDVSRFLPLYRFVGKGTWPEGGGTNDQTASFVAAVNVMDRWEAEWEADARAEKPNG
jgi:hypothetical protein